MEPGELQGTLEIEDFAIDAAQTKEVDINFKGELNANTYSGFQFDLSLPEGISITSVALNNELANAGFRISNTQTADKNKIRVVAFNASGKASDVTNSLVTLTATAAADAPHGDAQISISKASFSNLLGEDMFLSESETTVTINNVAVTGFTITPGDEQNIYVGQECTLSAEVVPQNATNKNFIWSVDNDEDGYVSVEKNENGEITVKGLKLGTAVLKLTASDYQGFSTTVNVNVVPTPAESVEISDANLVLLEGTTWQLSAKVLPEDTTDKTITWTSGSDETATVTQDGLVTAVKAGETTIKATCGDAEGICTVIVKAVEEVTVNPGTGSSEGDEDQNPGENTEDGMAVVGNDLILRVGQEGTVTLSITPEVDYDPALVWNLATGGDSYVQMSMDEQSSLSATFRGLAVGKTTYTVSTPANGEEILSGNITVIAENPVMSLTLTPESISLAKNALPYQLTATITPENVTTSALSWSSSLETIATVDAEGKVTPVGEGECDITVTTTDGTGLSAVCHVTVTAPIDDNFEFDFDESVMGDAEGISIYLGDTYKFVPKAKEGYVLPDNITWSSSDPLTVSVEEENGTIHGLQLGEGTITASATVNGQTVTATCKVTVIPVPATSIRIDGGDVTSIKRKETLTLTAIVLPANTTYPDVTWESSSDEIATVSPTGVVTGQNPGQVTITAYVTKTPTVKDTYVLEITDLLLGDSNDNGIVTVADVVTTANHIINMPVAAWSFVNADVTQDDQINIADVNGTVDIILNDADFLTLRKVKAYGMETTFTDRLISENYVSGEPQTMIGVKLTGSKPYSAIQATLMVPEGMKVMNVVAGPGLSDHFVMFNEPTPGIVKIIIFSLYNTEFNTEDTPLFYIVADTRNSFDSLEMTEIFGSDAQSNEYELGFEGGLQDFIATGVGYVADDDVMIRPVADGIEVLNAEGLDVYVYRSSGETVANVKAMAPVERIRLENGMYIVKTANTTAKVLVKY